MRRDGLAAGIATLLVALTSTAVAHASEVIGQTGPPVLCAQDNAYTQALLAGGPSYSPSAYGVITSWSTMADAAAGRTVKLIVLHKDSDGPPRRFTAVQKDVLRMLTADGQPNTFTGVRLPIEAGEQISLYVPGGQPGGLAICGFSASGANTVTSNDPVGEPPLGVSQSYSSSAPNLRLNASAVVEPDADSDGFGDETQDACPTDDSVQGACPVPDTTITQGPKDKTKKKKATFEFSSSIADATFECSLDGAAFAPCTSPDTLKVKKGKHHFEVRATAKGQSDDSPATDDWKVKKKKK